VGGGSIDFHFAPAFARSAWGILIGLVTKIRMPILISAELPLMILILVRHITAPGQFSFDFQLQ
jgi:hypothetical protein